MAGQKRAAAKRVDETSEEEAFYASLVVQHGTDCVLMMDRDMRVRWANPAAERLTGYKLDDMLGKMPHEFLHGSDTDGKTEEHIQEAVRQLRPVRTEILNYSRMGEAYWVDLSISPVFGPDGRHTHFLSVARNISERRRLQAHSAAAVAAEQARRAERRLLSQSSEWLYAARSIDELLTIFRKCMLTLFPDSRGQLYVYSQSRAVLELATHWGVGFLQDSIDPDDCWCLRRGRAYAFGMNEIDFPCSHAEDAETASFCIPVIADGDTIGMLHLSFPECSLASREKADLKPYLEQRWDLALICAEQVSLAIANVRLQQELQEQSVRDQLTGLLNRRWFLDYGNKELNRALARCGQLSLVSLDIDHFKQFNDRFGHDAGDEVLRQVATLMTRRFTGAIVPCRLGGEEFVVVAPDTGADEAMALAEGFRKAVGELRINHAGTTLPAITVSAGVATAPLAADTLETLLRESDIALYAAKQAGRDRTIVSETSRAEPACAAE